MHLITNLSEVFGSNVAAPAWMLLDDAAGTIAAVGTMTDSLPQHDSEYDARGGVAIPSYCDSHTHIVYAGCRDREFVDKINGLTYEEIARRGGGILNSTLLLRRTSEDDLFSQSLDRACQVMNMGTGAIEIKSGYGLDLDSELKMLRVVARIAENVPMTVKATFLGAHAVPAEFNGDTDAYVDHICRVMMPAVAAQGIADFVDVFCDRGFFTPDHTGRILDTAAKYGLRPKIHANELDNSGGVEVAVAHHALSADHLERAEAPQLQLLASSRTVATMMPGASFFLGMPYAPARQALDAGCRVALASDFNPGSSPSGDMRFVWTLACVKMRLLPAVALTCLTAGGAMAMDIAGTHGTLSPGMAANIIVTRRGMAVDTIPYLYTTPYIARHYINAKWIRN